MLETARTHSRTDYHHRRSRDRHRPYALSSGAVQESRFDAISEMGDFHGYRVLETPCGLGDFLVHLLKWDIIPDYVGLDPRADIIARCRSRFEERLGPACRFVESELLQYSPAKRFDYVIVHGLFGAVLRLTPERAEAALKKAFSWCEVGMTASFPIEALPQALDWAMAITPAVRLRRDYLPNEFMLYLYRTPSWEEIR